MRESAEERRGGGEAGEAEEKINSLSRRGEEQVKATKKQQLEDERREGDTRVREFVEQKRI